MNAFDDDETFERELFALRAKALAAPSLDLDAVLSRVKPQAVRRLAPPQMRFWGSWVAAAACAAAACFGLVTTRTSRPHIVASSDDPGRLPVKVNVIDDVAGKGAVCAVAPDLGVLACHAEVDHSVAINSPTAFAPVDFVVSDSMCGGSPSAARLMCQ